MIHAFVRKATPEQIAAGEQYERQVQQAATSYDENVVAPPCVACGKPVADKDFERHRYEAHAGNEMVQPWGRPDAREALFLARNPDELQRKVAIWREKHPGVILRLAGDGQRYGGLMVWARYRVLDAKGKLA